MICERSSALSRISDSIGRQWSLQSFQHGGDINECNLQQVRLIEQLRESRGPRISNATLLVWCSRSRWTICSSPIHIKPAGMSVRVRHYRVRWLCRAPCSRRGFHKEHSRDLLRREHIHLTRCDIAQIHARKNAILSGSIKTDFRDDSYQSHWFISFSWSVSLSEYRLRGQSASWITLHASWSRRSQFVSRQCGGRFNLFCNWSAGSTSHEEQQHGVGSGNCRFTESTLDGALTVSVGDVKSMPRFARTILT